MTTKNSKLVYSTDQGRIKDKKTAPIDVTGDGIIRIRRETKGRKGKGVTTMQGFHLPEGELKTLCKHLKNLCGCGGTVKKDVIEIQGDHREKLKGALEEKGYSTKLAGG